MLAFKLVAVIVGMAIAQGQSPPSHLRQIGIVKRVDAAARVLVLASDSGEESQVSVPPEARVLRVAPGEKDLSKAAAISLAEIEAGDRVLVRGAATGGHGIVAETVVVMSRADVARKQEAERAEWRRRGISGKVSIINADARELTITVPGPTPASVIVRLQPGTIQRRYRSDSVRFADAQPSTLADIKLGDQIHALGERSADGASFSAEQIVSGSFHNFAAVIASVDSAQHALSAKNVDGNKPVLVRIGPDSIMRKLPPEFAEQLAARRNNGPGQTAGPGGPAAQRRRTLDLLTIRDRFPALTLEELKPGDVIIVSSGESSVPNRINALVILAGAEPLLTQPAAAQRELLGSWNLNLDPDVP